jgi:hypothetical protein
MVWINTAVEIDLRDINDNDLIEELECRDYVVTAPGDNPEPDSNVKLLELIWQLRREGKPYDSFLDQYIYEVLGKLA